MEQPTGAQQPAAGGSQVACPPDGAGGDTLNTSSQAQPQLQQLPGDAKGPPAATAVLRLRGLPFSASAADISSFFTGYAVEEVHICKRHGRAYGQALVVLDSPESARAAFTSLHKKNLGTRYIEIFNATEKDVEAVKQLAEDAKRQGYVVRLRGLPFAIAASDVAAWLEPVKLQQGADSVHLTYNTVGRPTGEAYVELPDEEALQAVMRKHKDMLGPRYIEVFASTRSEMSQALQQSSLNRQQASYSAPRLAADPSTAYMAAQFPGAQLMAGAGGMDELTGAFQGFYINPAATGRGAQPAPYQQAARLMGYTHGVGGLMQRAGGQPGGLAQVPGCAMLPGGMAALSAAMTAGMQAAGQQQPLMMQGAYLAPMQQAGIYAGAGMASARGMQMAQMQAGMPMTGAYMPGYGMAPAGVMTLDDGSQLQPDGFLDPTMAAGDHM